MTKILHRGNKNVPRKFRISVWNTLEETDKTRCFYGRDNIIQEIDEYADEIYKQYIRKSYGIENDYHEFITKIILRDLGDDE